MTRVVLLLTVCLASASAVPATGRIAIGSTGYISTYPFAASLLYSRIGVGVFTQACGGSIITYKTVLTSAYCLHGESVNTWRVRVGSSTSSSGGVVHILSRIIVHPLYNTRTSDNDIGLLHVSTPFAMNSNVKPGTIAGANFYLPDNKLVEAIGWGLRSNDGEPSNQLLYDRIYTINWSTCQSRYSEIGRTVTSNMVCVGKLDVNGYGQCVALPPAVRIVGGSNAAITSYRFAASLLHSRIGVGTFIYGCGGSIITNRVILTAAYCLYNEPVYRWRVRVGSARSSTGGVIHNTQRTLVHPNYNPMTADNDIALLHSMTVFVFNNNVNSVGVPSVNYNLPDNQPVTALGWGATSYGGQLSDTLRRVDIWTVNRNVCRTRYSELGYSVTDNMLCAGWLDVGGRGACIGDTGSALIHLNRNVQTIVGVYSWSYNCALPRYPSVNAFVPRYTNWILANA
ncbi:unnamed protein product [Danaus chrysippus]|uniref:(African queen) hypothetical protein n=1 Tax=Danaus chrysippus TaxID=151541 RepID=A0A8J2R4W6_9NEOP|nr:unnamed protein product [Danaus chrysippus]